MICKGVKIDGLTGRIRFNSNGKRVNFSLDVLEMTPESELVKIGSWSDVSGLKITRNPLLNEKSFVPTQHKSIQ